MKKDTNIYIYRTFLKDYLEKYHNITNFKKHFHCLNPNHTDSHPSMYFSRKYNIVNCFSCNEHYDIFDLIGLDYSLPNFKDQLNKFKELYDINTIEITDKPINKINEDVLIDYSYYFRKCYNNTSKSDYLLKRGISSFLISKYKIGYDIDKKAVVFPINKNSYFRRSTISNEKIKSRGTSYLWNEDLINNKNKLIFICEGIIDSLSLETIDKNVKTISLNGVTNYKRLIDLCIKNKYSGCFVICFDNDSSGIKAQKDLKVELSKIGIDSYCISLLSNFSSSNDLNEALLEDKEKLKQNYSYIKKCLKKYIDEKDLLL